MLGVDSSFYDVNAAIDMPYVPPTFEEIAGNKEQIETMIAKMDQFLAQDDAAIADVFDRNMTGSNITLRQPEEFIAKGDAAMADAVNRNLKERQPAELPLFVSAAPHCRLFAP
jgi:hypothetical protein